jgi:hypothetical protein
VIVFFGVLDWKMIGRHLSGNRNVNVSQSLRIDSLTDQGLNIALHRLPRGVHLLGAFASVLGDHCHLLHLTRGHGSHLQRWRGLVYCF